MVRSCAVASCGNFQGKNKDDLHFFVLPKSPRMRTRWLSKIGRKMYSDATNIHVCSNHFTAEDYAPEYLLKKTFMIASKASLRKGAVPSQKLTDKTKQR